MVEPGLGRRVGAEQHHAHLGAALLQQRERRERQLDTPARGLLAGVDRDRGRLAPALGEGVGVEVRAALEPLRFESVVASQDLRHPWRVGDAPVAHAIGLLGPDVLRRVRIEGGLEVLHQIDLLVAARQVPQRVGGGPLGRDPDVGADPVVEAVEHLGLDRDEVLEDPLAELAAAGALVAGGIEHEDHASVSAPLHHLDQAEDRHVTAGAAAPWRQDPREREALLARQRARATARAPAAGAESRRVRRRTGREGVAGRPPAAAGLPAAGSRAARAARTTRGPRAKGPCAGAAASGRPARRGPPRPRGSGGGARS